MTKDEARTIAATIAKLPEGLGLLVCFSGRLCGEDGLGDISLYLGAQWRFLRLISEWVFGLFAIRARILGGTLGSWQGGKSCFKFLTRSLTCSLAGKRPDRARVVEGNGQEPSDQASRRNLERGGKT